MVEDGYLSDQDIFAEEESHHEPACPKTPLAKPAESELMTRLRGMMAGIPPPPERTNPQIDMAGMLAAWNRNPHLHWNGIQSTPDTKSRTRTYPRARLEIITNKDVVPREDLGAETNKNSVDKENSEIAEFELGDEQKRFGVYMNLDSEEEEILRIRVAERLISSETSSSFVQHVFLTNSAKKRQRRNGWAKSPGSRLSYLAKRRTTFGPRPDLGSSRSIAILKEDKKPSRDRKQPVPLKRALFQSPDKMDLSTPDCSRVKRLKMTVPSQAQGTPPRNGYQTGTKRKSSVSRNLESTFNNFLTSETNPDLPNTRQKLWQRPPLASLSSS